MALALTGQVAGQGLIAYGFAHLPASFSSVTLMLQPLVAAIAAWTVLHEHMTPIEILGGVIVLLGIGTAKRG